MPHTWLSPIDLCGTGSRLLIISFYFKNHIHQSITSHFPFLLLQVYANLMIKLNAICELLRAII
jgi:hypothetical protein